MKIRTKRIVVGLFLGFALFLVSLLYSHQTTSTVYIHSDGASDGALLCGVCGNQELILQGRGFPFAAYTGFDDETVAGIPSSAYDGTRGWKPIESIADLVFWIVVAEIGVFVFTKLKTKSRK